jgi:hypothetical protein
MTARREPNARQALESLVAMQESSPLDMSLGPYHLGGFVASFRTVCQAERWNDAVVEVIELGQRIASDWKLAGNIACDPSGWTTRSRVSGVSAIHWVLSVRV